MVVLNISCFQQKQWLKLRKEVVERRRGDHREDEIEGRSSQIEEGKRGYGGKWKWEEHNDIILRRKSIMEKRIANRTQSKGQSLEDERLIDAEERELLMQKRENVGQIFTGWQRGGVGKTGVGKLYWETVCLENLRNNGWRIINSAETDAARSWALHAEPQETDINALGSSDCGRTIWNATRQFDQRSNHASINEVMAISLATTIWG